MCFKIPFCDLDTAFKKQVREMCTIRMKPTEYEPTPPTYHCFRVDEKTKTVSVPLGLWNEFYETPPNDDLVYPPINIEFRGSLYTKTTDPKGYRDQVKVVQEALGRLNQTRSVLLNLATGWGKTVTAIHISTVLNMKTLVLCHLRVVVGQWCEGFSEFTSAVVENLNETTAPSPDANVYVCGIKRCIKLVAAHPEMFEGIGLIVVDEAHVATVSAFANCLLKLPPSKYLLGLTATPDRADKLDTMFKPYFGSPQNYIVRTHIKEFLVVQFLTRFKPDIEYTLVRGKTILNWARVQNSLAYNSDRNQLIVDLAQAYKNKVILILCGRVAQSEEIYAGLLKKGDSADIFCGTAQTYDPKARVLVASAQKAGVGFDNSNFTMLILAFDVKDVRQFEGRIRTNRNIVLDIVDANKTLDKHWKIRKRWYTKRGATFQTIKKIPRIKNEK
jgi:hypothetical protein